MRHSKILGSLYVQVLIAIACGVLLGYFAPERGAAMKPLGDGFIKLIRMMIGPVVFCTVVLGIARVGALKEVGRIGVRAILYFEVASTAALAIGLVVVNVTRPGSGISVHVSQADLQAVASYTSQAKALSVSDFLLNVIPTTVVDAFVKGEILQVLLVSLLAGIALLQLGERANLIVLVIEQLSHVLFQAIGLIMRLAPIGSFGAMSFTIGRYGVGSLVALGKLMIGVYATCVVFVFVVLGLVLRFTGFSIWKLVAYIREEILIVLGTSSSESALPRIMTKLEQLGCAKPVVGLVVPTGYSFNLDGTAIYMTMGAVFIAQATGSHLSIAEQLGIIAVLLVTSKGAAAVTGGGFVTLAATLAVIPRIPLSGLALLLGVDRFMSEARAITNLIGNAVATVAVAHWSGALDRERAERVLNGDAVPAASVSELEDAGVSVAASV